MYCVEELTDITWILEGNLIVYLHTENIKSATLKGGTQRQKRKVHSYSRKRKTVITKEREYYVLLVVT